MKYGHRVLAGIVLLLWISYGPAYGQEVIEVQKDKEKVVINPHVYIFNDQRARIDDIAQVMAAPDSAFTKNVYYQEVKYGFSRPSGWCKFKIQNTSDHTDWILKVHQSRVDTVQLYAQKQNGELVKYPLTGHFQNIKDRAFYSLHFAYPVSIGKSETVTFYLFTLRKFARHAAVLSLEQENHYRNYETLFIIFISALTGICILAGLTGIVMFIFARKGLYLLQYLLSQLSPAHIGRYRIFVCIF